MPRKPKFTREMIVDTALDMVRVRGWSALSARNIANHLKASVGPIYSLMESMAAVEAALIARVYELLHASMLTTRTGDPIVNLALGYICFARDERNLFKCFIDEKYASLRRPHSDRLWKQLAAKFTADARYAGLTRAQIEEHRRKMTVFTYGLAVLINSGARGGHLGDAELATILSETGEMLLAGLRATTKEKDVGVDGDTRPDQ